MLLWNRRGRPVTWANSSLGRVTQKGIQLEGFKPKRFQRGVRTPFENNPLNSPYASFNPRMKPFGFGLKGCLKGGLKAFKGGFKEKFKRGFKEGFKRCLKRNLKRDFKESLNDFPPAEI